MSYFSDLAVAEMESVKHDNSYPSPVQQIVFLIEDVVSKYLQLGGDFSTVEAVFDGANKDVSIVNRELLYSAESFTSPDALIMCLKTALSILHTAEDDTWNCSDVLIGLRQMFVSDKKTEVVQYAA